MTPAGRWQLLRGSGPAEGPDVLPLSADPAPAEPICCCRWETMKSPPCGPWRPPTACPTPRRPTARTSALCRMGTMCRFLRQLWRRGRPSPVTSWTQKARVLGRHRGMECYTIGQRKGLGVSANAPLYVLGKDPDAECRDPGGGQPPLHPGADGGAGEPASPVPAPDRPLSRSPPRPGTASGKLPPQWNRCPAAAFAWCSQSPSGPSPRGRRWCSTMEIWCWAGAPSVAVSAKGRRESGVLSVHYR